MDISNSILMKNIAAICLLILSAHSFAQENEAWRLGLQIGLHGNSTYASGGQLQAHSRFHNNDAGSLGVTFQGRFDYNKHWMVLFGLGVNSFGFDYAIAENYSLLNPDKNYSKLTTEFAVVEAPIMLHYKFNPNCKNNKWLIGAGFSQGLLSGENIEKAFANNVEAVNELEFVTQTQVNNSFFTCLRLSLGLEKTYKNGSILNGSLYANIGFKSIAQSTVNYKLDNTNYQHRFSNNGNFIGLKLAYFLKPFNKA